MKAVPKKLVVGQGYVVCKPEEATHLTLNFPGPQQQNTFPVMLHGTRAGTGNWTWNGSTDKPTLKPSVLVTSGHYVSFHKSGDKCWCTYNQEHPLKPAPCCCFRCHSWVSDGKVQFLSDSTHEHANKTLDLLEVF